MGTLLDPYPLGFCLLASVSNVLTPVLSQPFTRCLTDEDPPVLTPGSSTWDWSVLYRYEPYPFRVLSFCLFLPLLD